MLWLMRWIEEESRMNKQGLTPQQHQVYLFIRSYYTEYGYFPTQREISVGKLDGEQVIPHRRSPASIHRIVNVLVEKGWLHKTPGNARALEFV